MSIELKYVQLSVCWLLCKIIETLSNPVFYKRIIREIDLSKPKLFLYMDFVPRTFNTKQAVYDGISNMVFHIICL